MAVTLSVVSPAFNEREVLPRFHLELGRVLRSLGEGVAYEIVYVDDGSSDGTTGLLREWARADERVRYVALSRNFGKQAAFAAGLDHARGDAVVLLDSDLQHPPALIPELLANWKRGADVVVTLRSGHYEGRVRHLFSRCFGFLLRRLSSGGFHEEISDFCLLSRRAVEGMARMRETHRYLRGLVQWLGYPTAEVRFRPAPRPAGHSKFSPRRLIALAMDATFSFSRTPLRLVTGLGFLSLFAGVLAVVLGLSGTFGPRMDGTMTALLASLYFVGGAVLCGLGVVGEYAGRAYEQSKARPLYLVKETEAVVREPAAAGGRP